LSEKFSCYRKTEMFFSCKIENLFWLLLEFQYVDLWNFGDWKGYFLPFHIHPRTYRFPSVLSVPLAFFVLYNFFFLFFFFFLFLLSLYFQIRWLFYNFKKAILSSHTTNKNIIHSRSKPTANNKGNHLTTQQDKQENTLLPRLLPFFPLHPWWQQKIEFLYWNRA